MDDSNPTQNPTTPPASARNLLLHGTPQLLASVPHLLGYEPGRSVVVMASVRCGGPTGTADAGIRTRIRMTARFDHPAPDDAMAAVSTLAVPLARVGREAMAPVLLHVFVFEADDEVAAAVAAATVLLTRRDGHTLHDLVLVREGRYLPLVEEGADPAGEQHATGDRAAGGWRDVPVPADVPAVADLVLDGRFPAAGRDDVAARVRARDEPAAAATGLSLTFLRLAPEAVDPLEALRRLGAWVVHGDAEPAPRERARIVATLEDRTVRDAVMARWLPRLFTVEEVVAGALAREVRGALPPWPREESVAALDRLLWLAARVPRSDAVALLTVAGAMAWGSGEGTVANEAIDLARETDPTYRMAQLLREALDRGAPPWSVRTGRRAADVA